METLHTEAFALRPVRLVARDAAFRYYTAVTFPQDPREGCSFYLRRCDAFVHLRDETDGGDTVVIDVLNEDGDIVQDYPLSREGLALLRRLLGLRVAHGDATNWT